MKKVLLFTTLLSSLIAGAQTVTTFAGKSQTDGYDKFSGSDAKYADAYFNFPYDLDMDGSGRIFVSQASKIAVLDNGTVRNRSGWYGSPLLGQGYINASGIQARFTDNTGIAVDPNGDLFIVDESNHAVRKMSKYINVSTQQAVSTFAGAAPKQSSGTSGTADGALTSARFENPKSIAIDKNGNIYVTGFYNQVIRKISGGQVSTLAGKSTEAGSTDGTGDAARFSAPYGVVMYDNDHILVSDQFNFKIRKVNINSGATTTFAGSGTFGSTDGPVASATFSDVRGMAVVGNAVYVCDGSRIRVIQNGTVSTFAGSATQGTDNGEGTAATFGTLSGMVYDAANSAILVTDISYHNIRKVTVPEPVASVSNLDMSQYVSIYPNPVKNEFRITTQSHAPKSFNYVIQNLQGQTVKEGVTSFNTAIEVAELPTGVYFVKGISEAGIRFDKKILID